MSGKLQVDRRFMPGGDPMGTPLNAASPDDVDEFVSDFLQELTGISATIKQAPQEEAIGIAAETSPPAQAELAQELPPVETIESNPEPAEPQAEIPPPPELDLSAINKEIEETLIELEHQKPVVIPITFQKEAAKSPPPQAAKSQPPDPTPSSPQAASRQKAAPRPQKPEVQEWARLDIFRAEVVSSRSARRKKVLLYAIAGAVLFGILLYFLISQLDKI